MKTVHRHVIFVLCLLVTNVSAARATRWALAERSEDDIRARVEQLRSVLGDVVSDREARILSDELYMNVYADGHVIMQNRVIEILGNPAPGLAIREIGLPPGYEATTVAGFVVQ